MNLSQINKKLIRIVAIVLGIVIVAVVAIMIIAKEVNLEFSVIEQKLQQGAKKYFKDNPELLPQENGEKAVVGVTTLEDGKYIPLLSKMVKGDTICNGEVRVSNNGGFYYYIPYLNCGNTHVTTELYQKIIDSSNIVTEDDGLYQINDEYVFRGEPTNNFIKFADQLWMIIKVDKDNHIKIIQYETKNRNIWDDRYNVDRESNEGINDYTKSIMEKSLLEMFNDDKFIPESLKGLIVHKPFCIGKRSETEKNKTGSIECSKLSEPQPIGLIQTNDFLNASLDKNCKTTTSPSCQNYNYLAKANYNWWTITASSEKTHRVYRIMRTEINDSPASNETRIRAVLHLSDNIIYNSGTGTYDDPYIIK